MEIPGKMLTEIQNQIVQNAEPRRNPKPHYVVRSRVDFVKPEYQLIAKGLDPQVTSIIDISDTNTRTAEKRFLYVAIEVNDEEEYFIIEKRYLLPEETIISIFRFYNTNYALIKPELPK